MSDEQGDQDLRRRFAALRERETREVPGFAGLWRKAEARGGARASRRVAAAVAAVAVAGGACALLLAIVARHPSPAASPRAETIAAPSLSAWRAPTDFLLCTPALEILTTVPALGEATPPPVPSPSIERSHP